MLFPSQKLMTDSTMILCHSLNLDMFVFMANYADLAWRFELVHGYRMALDAGNVLFFSMHFVPGGGCHLNPHGRTALMATHADFIRNNSMFLNFLIIK
jgi:hypothetical protein